MELQEENKEKKSMSGEKAASSKDLSQLQLHPVWARKEDELAGISQNGKAKKVSLDLQEETEEEEKSEEQSSQAKPEIEKNSPKVKPSESEDTTQSLTQNEEKNSSAKQLGDTEPMFQKDALQEQQKKAGQEEALRKRQQSRTEQENEVRKRRPSSKDSVKKNPQKEMAQKKGDNATTVKTKPEKNQKKTRRKMTQAERARYLEIQKRKKRRKKICTIFIVIFALVFLLAGYQLMRVLKDYKSGGNEYEEIRTSALVLADGQKEKTAMAGDFHVNFDALTAQNPDTVAWIRFEEPSVISYPVVKSWDNEEYLTQSFSLNDNKLGAIFMDMNNSEPLADRNTLIYGHNMKIGGEMFSQLNSYADEEFCKQNPYFYLYTMDGKVSYCRVFAAGIVKEDSPRYRLDFASDADFQEYLNMCVNESDYQVDVELNARCTIVTLSTCTNGNSDERFMVQGVVTRQERTEGSRKVTEEDNQQQSEEENQNQLENESQSGNEGGY